MAHPVDTINNGVLITPDRMNEFQFTNAHDKTILLAIYAQNKNHTKLIDFTGLAAGISMEIYLLTIVFCCLLLILFAFIEYVRPSNTFNCLILHVQVQ